MDPWDKVLSGANMEPLCFAFVPVKSDDSVGTYRYMWDDGERMDILPLQFSLQYMSEVNIKLFFVVTHLW